MPSMAHTPAQGASRNTRTPNFPTPGQQNSVDSTSNFTPQQLSPDYALSGSRNTLFGQPTVFQADRRTMSGFGSNIPGMSGFGMPTRSYNPPQSSMSAFHSSFSGSTDSGTPPLLDLSEFPSLTNRRESMLQPSPMPVKPYVGMVKQPANESSEFTISFEDFPALPGTQKSGPSQSVAGDKSGSAGRPQSTEPNSADGMSAGQDGSSLGLGTNNNPAASRAPGAERQQALDRGVQTHPDGRVSNIPASMVKDQFGIIGLLTFIRVAESEPNLVAMSLGQDLKNLGLNLNSPENIYPTFGGPFADAPCRPQDIDYHVPQEYLVNATIRDKLPMPKLSHQKEDLLFYFFYCFVGDAMQLAAAAELYNRDWRYHMEEKVWISRAPGVNVIEKTNTYERGTYYFFDPQKWRKVAKEFLLEYAKLEERPHLPPQHTMYPPM